MVVLSQACKDRGEETEIWANSNANHMDPSDVRNQIGSFGEAFTKYYYEEYFWMACERGVILITFYF